MYVPPFPFVIYASIIYSELLTVDVEVIDQCIRKKGPVCKYGILPDRLHNVCISGVGCRKMQIFYEVIF